MRRLAIVLVALGLVTSAIYATGAFSGVGVSRNADVNVAGDASGYIGLHPASGPNGKYAEQDEKGRLGIELAEMATSESTGSGLNPDAVTTVNDVFTITNQGAQSTGLWLTDDSDAVTFEVGGRSVETEANAIEIAPGETKTVSIEVDTRRVEGDQNLLESVSFRASTDVSGRDVSGGGGSGDETAPADSSDSGQSDQPNPTPEEKKEDDDDGWSWGDDPVTGTIQDGGEAVLDTTGDIYNGIKEKGREELLKKLSYVTNQPLDALKSLGEEAWNTLIGFFLGEIGMPDGFTARESNSAFYLGGSMLSVLNPIADTLAGIRDFTVNLLKGDLIGAAIEAVGLLPPGKVVENLSDLRSITKTWIKYNPGQAEKMLQPIYDTFLTHFPKDPRQQIVDLFPGSVKRGDTAGSATSKSENPATEIGHLSKEKKHIGYTDDRMKRLVNNDKFTTGEIETLAKKNADLEVVEELSKRDFSSDQILYFVKNNDGTLLSPSLKQVKELSNKGYKPDDLEYIFKNGESKYIVAGPTPDQLIKLSDKGFSSGDVKYYVKGGVSLKFVGMLGKRASPKKVKGFVMSIRGAGEITEYYGLYRNAKNWCDMKEKNGKEIGICQKMPAGP